MRDPHKVMMGRLRAKIRQLWMWYGENRKDAYLSALILDSKPAKWLCAGCGCHFRKNKTKADHIEPCGGFSDYKEMGGFCEKMFKGKIQILCEECHNKKTAKEAEERNKRHSHES